MMESEEHYQLWLVQEERLLEVAEKKQYDHDLAIAKMERYAMLRKKNKKLLN